LLMQLKFIDILKKIHEKI